MKISTGNWVRALNLSERSGYFPSIPFSSPSSSACSLVRSWKEKAPFEDEGLFATRLAQDGLSEDTFLQLAGLSEENLWSKIGSSPVAETLTSAFTASSIPAVRLPNSAFFSLITPLVENAARRLTSHAIFLKERTPSAPFDPNEIHTLLWGKVADRLDWMLSRAVVLELYLAKLRDDLPGETSKSRFTEFIRRLSEPSAALEFFEEYSVLARCVVETLDLWVEAGAELLSRLASDWSQILSEFNPEGPPIALVQVSGGAGDLHCSGRAVEILTFDSGFRLVYKPRSVEIHGRFTKFLEWINERGAPNLRSGRSLSRDGYGWLEFVAARECENAQEINRFYRRQGSFLAIFYVLNATDFHRENLIACGDHPIFIDLECLLSPDFGQFDPKNHDSLAHLEMQDSVMRVMLLPFLHENARVVYDVSGLGGEGGQLSVNEVPHWINPGTDEMRLTKQRPAIGHAQNQPTLRGNPVSPLQYCDALKEGFETTYRLFLNHRSELLGENSPLVSLGQAEVRVVFRSSQFYSFILNGSYHPDLLRDALDRDLHFNRLWHGIDRSRLAEVSLKLLPFEREDLWKGDIPLFSCLADSLDVNSSQGQLIPGLLRRSGLEMARAQLQKLSEGDLNRQLWYLQASLSALTTDLEFQGASSYRPKLKESGSGRDRALEAATCVAKRLGELVLNDGEQAAWIGLAQTRSRGWQLRPLDADLYSGLPGVALFLAQSGAILSRPEDTQLSRLCLANLDRQLLRRNRVTTVGAFDGWGGLVFTWLYLARIWNDQTLVDKALDSLPSIDVAIGQDEDLDMIRGCAGGIVPLLALHSETGDETALELARKMGDRLLSKSQVFRESLCWQTASFPVHPLTGFSHGNSGFAWALVQLFAATKDEKYLQAARRALNFEQYFFSERKKNWMDLRSVQGAVGTGDNSTHALYSVSWCHGATGIGLSRTRMANFLDRSEMLQDAVAAAQTVVDNGFGRSHCLCHGDLGNIELLAELGQLENGPWESQIEGIAASIFDAFGKHGFLCGVRYVETPGLMNGLAGIGYGLLRLAVPERVPSVLLLDLPAGDFSATHGWSPAIGLGSRPSGRNL